MPSGPVAFHADNLTAPPMAYSSEHGHSLGENSIGSQHGKYRSGWQGKTEEPRSKQRPGPGLPKMRASPDGGKNHAHGQIADRSAGIEQAADGYDRCQPRPERKRYEAQRLNNRLPVHDFIQYAWRARCSQVSPFAICQWACPPIRRALPVTPHFASMVCTTSAVTMLRVPSMSAMSRPTFTMRFGNS